MLSLYRNNNEKLNNSVVIQRSSCGNSSFTAGTINNSSPNRELGRFANLNRSFNNVASDFRRKIHNLESTSESRLLKTNGSDLVRNFSQRVKHQVQSSLSDPLKGRQLLGRIGTVQNYLGSQCEEECGHCTICQLALSTTNNNLSGVERLQKANSVRKRINILSNKLQLPKFLSENNECDHSDRFTG